METTTEQNTTTEATETVAPATSTHKFRTSGLRNAVEEAIFTLLEVTTEEEEEQYAIRVATPSKKNGRCSFQFKEGVKSKKAALAVVVDDARVVQRIFAIPPKVCPPVVLMRPDETSKWWPFVCSKKNLKEAIERAEPIDHFEKPKKEKKARVSTRKAKSSVEVVVNNTGTDEADTPAVTSSEAATANP